eukprot:PhF_6_TR31367/c0_g1_i1/m.45926
MSVHHALDSLLLQDPSALMAISIAPKGLHKALCDIVSQINNHDDQIATILNQQSNLSQTLQQQLEQQRRIVAQNDALFEAMKSMTKQMHQIESIMSTKEDIEQVWKKIDFNHDIATTRYMQLDREKASLQGEDFSILVNTLIQTAIQLNNSTQSSVLKEWFEHALQDQSRNARQQFAKWKAELEEANVTTIRRVRQEIDGSELKVKGLVDDLAGKTGELHTVVKNSTGRVQAVEEAMNQMIATMQHEVSEMQNMSIELRGLLGLVPSHESVDQQSVIENCNRAMHSPLFTTFTTKVNEVVGATVGNLKEELLNDVDVAMRRLTSTLQQPLSEHDVTVLVQNEQREFKEVVMHGVQDILGSYSGEFAKRQEMYELMKNKMDVPPPGAEDQEKQRIDRQIQNTFKYLNERIEEIYTDVQFQKSLGEDLKRQCILLAKSSFLGTGGGARDTYTPRPPPPAHAQLTTLAAASVAAGRHAVKGGSGGGGANSGGPGGYLTDWVRGVELKTK